MPLLPNRSAFNITAFGWLAWLGLGAAGCSLFDDVDHFKPQKAEDKVKDAGSKDAGKKTESDASADGNDAGPSTETNGCRNPQTLCVRLQSFLPHVDQLVGVDLVTADHVLRARALLQGLPKNGTADILMPLAIPAGDVPKAGAEGTLHLEIFGDQSRDGKYTDDGSDHDWKVDLPANGKLVYAHNTGFTRLLPRPSGIGGDFRLRFKGMGVHIGKQLEVMVIEELSGRTVGLSRLREIPDDQFDVVIPGIIDVGGVVYRIEFYADANGNGEYDDPPIDHTWIRSGESSDKGFEFDFQHGTDFAPLGYQFKFEP